MSARGWVNHRIGTFTLDVAWDVEAGTVTALYGPSGAGQIAHIARHRRSGASRSGTDRIGWSSRL